MKKIRKILSVIERFVIKQMMYVNVNLYMKYYVRYLKKVGLNIKGKPNWIKNDVHFDGKDYSRISIGDNVTISGGVLLLTHDYSMHTVYKNLDINNIEKLENFNSKNSLLIMDDIVIGKNSFIGARSTLLPGTIIGENVLVGACSVVKGYIPDNSIVVGNPAKIIGNTNEWINKRIESL